MKTKLLTLAGLSLLLMNCSTETLSDKESDANNNEDSRNAELFKQYNSSDVINFAISNISRSSVIDNAYIQDSNNGFVFFGYKTNGYWASVASSSESSFMHNNHAIYKTADDNNFWYYGTPQKWPVGENVTFFAYAPFATEDNGISVTSAYYTNAPIISYDTNLTDLTKMIDIVTDCRDEIKDRNSENVESGTVSFNLSHVLTALNIRAKIKNELPTGKRVFITGIDIVPNSSIISKKANYNFGNDGWTNDTYISGNIDLSSILNLTTPSNSGSFATKSIEVTDGESETTLFKDSNRLFFIPVNNESGTANQGDVKIKVTYSVLSNGNAVETSKTVDLDSGILAKGKTYYYVLSFDIQADAIAVSATVLPWNTSNENLNL